MWENNMYVTQTSDNVIVDLMEPNIVKDFR